MRGVAAPKAGILELWDEKCGGLCLRVMKSGTRSWTFRYRPQGSATFRRVGLGKFPKLGVADARIQAERLRGAVREGDDPSEQKRAAREAVREANNGLTFDGMCDLYLERYAKPRKASWKNDENYLAKHARPALGERVAALITKQDAARLLFDVVAKAPTSANRLRSILVTMFAWAVDSSLLTENPMLGVKKPHKEGRGKTRVLRDDELRVLWRALDNEGVTPSVAAALRTLMLLGQRPGEVTGMASAELVDLDTRAPLWELGAERMKGRKPHVCPLPPLAQSIIKEQLARQREEDEQTDIEPPFVFASRFESRDRLARHTLSQAMRRVIGGLVAQGKDREVVARLKSDPPTPHDLRRTVATGLSRLGIPRDDRLAVLAHSYGDVHEVYDKYERLPEKRTALETWERHIGAVLNDRPGKGAQVLPLRRR